MSIVVIGVGVIPNFFLARVIGSSSVSSFFSSSSGKGVGLGIVAVCVPIVIVSIGLYCVAASLRGCGG